MVEVSSTEVGPSATPDEFYLQYGKALSAWADLEDALCDWFCRALEEDGQRDVNATGIFYSARSFAGRADMLKAASASRLLNAEERRFIRKALKKATDYNKFRSKLAHRVTVHRQGYGPDRDGLFLHEGDDTFGLNPEQIAIGVAELKNATDHFDGLKWVILVTAVLGGKSLEEGLRQVDQLPKEPHHSADSHLLEAIYAS